MALRSHPAAREAARADRETITGRYHAREPVSRIAADYGVSPTWLRNQLDTWGVPRRPAHEPETQRRPTAHVFKGRAAQPRTHAQVRAARADFLRDRTHVTARYEAGTSATRLAREYRVSLAWLTDTLDNWCVPRRTRP
ncbi:hypothetical protein [Streptomyces sp. Z26]|uniref:hypothetical protein n=1 Tax=Streptomyces TaxID=1883 RepID=UPI000EF15AC3|nr:hypothetical protein [Streptomyces sp. Z26]RLL69365.1 hypothetical protein D7M15_23870 [Streptomyces sp. Z26]